MGQIIGEGITFDDVLLVPSYSEVIPNQVDLTTWLTKKIKLNIPMSQSVNTFLGAIFLIAFTISALGSKITFMPPS